jgi:hypothetical protein
VQECALENYPAGSRFRRGRGQGVVSGKGKAPPTRVSSEGGGRGVVVGGGGSGMKIIRF